MNVECKYRLGKTGKIFLEIFKHIPIYFYNS